MNSIEKITKTFNSGKSALFLSGRPLSDLYLHETGTILTLLEGLRRTLRSQFNMVLITYSRSAGLDYDGSRLDAADRPAVEAVLEQHKLLKIGVGDRETAKIVRGVTSLLRQQRNKAVWKDGTEMKFAVLLDFTEHIAPGGLINGTQSSDQIATVELAVSLAQSLALRKSGNVLLFNGRYDLVSELLRGAISHVPLDMPEEQEKRSFIDAVKAKYPLAKFQNGIDSSAAARMTQNTPNRGVESLLLASERTGEAVTAAQLSEQKNRDIEAATEGTVRALDTSRVNGVKLCGRNIAVPQLFLQRCSEGLMKGDATTPSNVLLCGPPGTAKTDLCLVVANQANVAAYELINPKGQYVGETERKVRLQWAAVREWRPNVTFVDELSESVPISRGSWDGDNGASKAILAQILTATSDESRRGRTILMATSNCPWLLGEALRSRFTVLPVLAPLVEDYPAIISATAERVSHIFIVDETDNRVLEAARMFYSKAASPRHIRAALTNAAMFQSDLNEDVVLAAAHDFCAAGDRTSSLYAELWAIKACSSKNLLPWGNNPLTYPFPSHLDGLVDKNTGDVDRVELDKRLEELRPYVNV